MLYISGAKHGIFGFLSILLTIKIVIKKGLFVVEDIVWHQFLHLPLEILLIELPMSVFGTAGSFVAEMIGTTLPAEGIGLVVVYPLFVAAIVAIIDGFSLRKVGGHWLGSTLITGFAVAASIGLAPDPGSLGSGLAYHLQNHTLATSVREGILMIGDAISVAATATIGRPVDNTIGLLVAGTLAAFCWGVIWELRIGHENGDFDSS